jgi:hypothetical protein
MITMILLVICMLATVACAGQAQPRAISQQTAVTADQVVMALA